MCVCACSGVERYESRTEHLSTECFLPEAIGQGISVLMSQIWRMGEEKEGKNGK